MHFKDAIPFLSSILYTFEDKHTAVLTLLYLLTSFFSLPALKIFFLSLDLSRLIVMCLGFLCVYPGRYLWTSFGLFWFSSNMENFEPWFMQVFFTHTHPSPGSHHTHASPLVSSRRARRLCSLFSSLLSVLYFGEALLIHPQVLCSHVAPNLSHIPGGIFISNLPFPHTFMSSFKSLSTLR